MDFVILLYSDNTWEKCPIEDTNAHINAHEWKNEVDSRTVTTIFSWCSSTSVLKD